jgi:hypothetical protein
MVLSSRAKRRVLLYDVNEMLHCVQHDKFWLFCCQLRKMIHDNYRNNTVFRHK